MKIYKDSRGFTLIELLATIAIISILILLSVTMYNGKTMSAKEARIRHNIKAVESQVDIELALGKTTNISNKIFNTNLSYAIEKGKTYNREGQLKDEPKVINDDVDDTKLAKVHSSIINEANVKDKGIYYIDKEYNVYYYDNPIGLKEDGIKSATVIPYSLWDIDLVMNKVDDLKLNTVNLAIRVTTSDENAKDMKIKPEDLDDAIALSKALSEKDINIIVEPFMWIDEGNIGETELDPDNVDSWFWSWKTDVIHPILDRFEEEDIDILYLNVATNFVNLEYAEGYWKGVFKEVKDKDVQVMYRTNWWTTMENDEKSKETYNKKINSPLFLSEDLDVISIASYFELTDSDNPSQSEILKALKGTTVHNRNQNVYQEIKNVAESNGKEVFFGELGTPSTKGYAKEPWNDGQSDKIIKNAHYNYLNAYMKTFWEEDWFTGFSLFMIGDNNSKYNITDQNAIKLIRDLY